MNNVYVFVAFHYFFLRAMKKVLGVEVLSSPDEVLM